MAPNLASSPHRYRFAAIVSLLVVLGIVLAACGGGGSTTTPAHHATTLTGQHTFLAQQAWARICLPRSSMGRALPY